jgi:hypothetical protein
MQRLPFPLESYEHPSKPLNAKHLYNMMSEQAPGDSRTQAALVPTPGLTAALLPSGAALVVGTGPIHALNDNLPGARYVVSGTRFYRLSYPLTGGPVVYDLGDIGTPDTGTIPNYDLMHTIATGPTAAVVVVPPRAYTCGHADTDVLNQVGGGFPGAATVTYHDGYFVFSSFENSAKFFISKLWDPNNYDALDFAYSDGLPNVLRRVISYRSDIWMMGEGGLEIWYDAGSSGLETTPGTSFFPFRRRAGGVIATNLSTPRSVCVGDNSVWWIGHDAIVYRSVNYQATRVSTHAVEEILRSLVPLSMVSAVFYSQQGHSFYAINFPYRTLVYDCATQVWHDRSSDAVGGRWRVNAVASHGPDLLFGDATSGQLFNPTVNAADAGLELGAPMTRQIILPPLWAGTSRAFCSRLEVEMESGDARLTDGDLQLDWSDDGGFTWSGGPRTLTAQVVNGRRQRVFTTRLGSFRQRVFRLTWRGAVTIYAADAAIVGGTN